MPASILASFLSFLITGIYSFYFLDIFPLNLTWDIKLLLLLSIIMNAIYFFYFESLTEIDETVKLKLKKLGKTEWYIRILNQTVLFSLWFLFQIHPLAFCGGLITLYILYIYWDNLTKDCYEDRKLFKLDVAGLVISIFFILFSIVNYVDANHEKSNIPETVAQNTEVPNDSNSKVQEINTKSNQEDAAVVHPLNPETKIGRLAVYWSFCLVGYMLIPFFGFYYTKNELFKKKYWTRQGIA